MQAAGSTQISDADLDRVCEECIRVRSHAYSPYSGFAVGAALLCDDGTLVSGCNVENVSFGLTVCAERGAICAAVARGFRHFRAMAVCADSGEMFVGPCGMCRQVLAEFSYDMTVILVKPSGERKITKLRQMLPDAFLPTNTNLAK